MITDELYLPVAVNTLGMFYRFDNNFGLRLVPERTEAIGDGESYPVSYAVDLLQWTAVPSTGIWQAERIGQRNGIRPGEVQAVCKELADFRG